jgi:ferritin-like metal-binding protein YciE
LKVNSLKELYVEELKDTYDAEKQIVKALPKIVKASSTPELQKAFKGAPGTDQGSRSTPGADLQPPG